MSPSRRSNEQFARNRGPHMQSDARGALEENSTDLEFFESVRQEAEEELRAIPNLKTDSSSDNDKTSDQH